MTYLDWASTSPPELSILTEAASLAAAAFGNPSSRHGPGEEARARLEEARLGLGSALGLRNGLGGSDGRIAFTSGGSEADAIALLALLRRQGNGIGASPHLVTTNIEHSAIHGEARLLESMGIPVTFVDPREDGRIIPGDIAQAMRKETALVAVMAVNNETGAVQPLAEIAQAVNAASLGLGRKKPPHIHSDAVQALGKLPFHPASLGISSAAFSAHKLRGPRGVGALWLNAPLEPLVVGGGQEGGTRPGTENLQGAWAFAMAAERALGRLGSNEAHGRALEARLFSGIGSIRGAMPLPIGRRAGDPRYVPQIVSLAFPGLSGEVLARGLSDEGFAVSTGAACSSRQRKKGRRILDAMGLHEELSLSAIRVSTGELTTGEDIDRFLQTLESLYRRLKT